jgi:signal transduction histidine kinase/thioredoxin reductase
VDTDVLIVGAGPAGLAAAAELRRLGGPRVLVADREGQPGGIPRHSFHPGYGLRDLHRLMSGPAYARALADAAGRAGAELRTGCTVTELRVGDALSAVLTSAAGIEEVRPAAVLLATGCRERPRPARLVPGDRPSGVLTTGELQQRVYLGGERLGGRALVVGAEHVSFSAMVTLAHAGARVIALVTEHERQQSYAAFRVGAALRWGVPVWTSTAVTRVTGAGGRLASVDVARVAGGQPRTVACDWLVFTGDWIPDHVLARSSGLVLDAGTRGPVVDTRLATSALGVFAAGNLVHAAETADVAALSGRHAARQIDSFLAGRASPSAGGIPVVAESPLRWISPNVIAAGPVPPPLGRFTLRAAGFRPRARLETRQDGRLLARSRPLRLIPGRPVYLRASWLAQVDPGGGPVRVGLEHAGLCGHRPKWLTDDIPGGRRGRIWRRLHARWHDAEMKPWLRQGTWLAVALITPVLLSLALLPVRSHVSDVLIALILLTVSAAAVARGELLLSLVAATSTALSFDYFYTAPYDQFAIRGAQGVVTSVALIAAVPALGTWIGRLYGKEAARERELREKAEQYAGELAERQRQVEQLATELTASRRRILAVGDQMRRQIERDLHDGAQQHLVSLSLMLRGIRDQAPADIRADIDEVSDGLAGALQELRDLSRGLHPAILAEAGLGPAVRALARRSPLPVRVQVQAGGRLPAASEATAYYVAAEAFTNAAKHAAASAVDILIERAGAVLTVQVRDDGVGGADATRGSGLTGLRDRVEAVGGTMTLDSPARAGTVLTVQLPVTAEVHLPAASRSPGPGLIAGRRPGGQARHRGSWSGPARSWPAVATRVLSPRSRRAGPVRGRGAESGRRPNGRDKKCEHIGVDEAIV